MNQTQKERFLQLRQEILEQIFAKMNGPQKEAVFQIKGPILILAGAGSGKTTVVVNRIANIIEFGEAYHSEEVPPTLTEEDLLFLEQYRQGQQEDYERMRDLLAVRPAMPWNVLAITFTNKAASELKSRLEGMLGEKAQDIQASTFHSACVRILRREIEALGYARSFTIYDTDDSVRVIKDGLKELNINDKNFPPKMILGAISRAKDAFVSPEQMVKESEGDFRKATIAKVYAHYRRQLKSANALDFDDIILLTVQLFQEFPQVLEHYRRRFRYIMVDEYQDTNNCQYQLVSLLSGGHNNICVVGDDDQSIYKFRGATIENILNFENQFPQAKVIRLEQNYRSTQTILNAANAVITHNSQRKGKTLWTDNDKGPAIQIFRGFNEQEECQFVVQAIQNNVAAGEKFSDHAILYRMNAQSNAIENALVRSGISYKIVGGQRFYERKEIKDVLAYLSVINNPADTVRLKRIINEPKRGIGDATVNKAQEIADTVGLTLFEVLRTAEEYEPLSRKAPALKSFASSLEEIAGRLEEDSLEDIFEQVMEASGYRLYLMGQGEEGKTRLENVDELKSNIISYSEEQEEPTLSGFLEEVALYADIDSYNADTDAVVLMTIHSAKGLEFDNVFLCGAEEGIFPGVQSMYNEEEIQEERRLAYVCITRARKRFYVSTAAQRMLFGQTTRNRVSRFVGEIPAELCEIHDRTIERVKALNQPADTKPAPQPKSTQHLGIGRQTQSQPFNLTPGDRVSHKTFGEGLVLTVTPMGNDHLVEVAFDRVGTKKIMAKFARLQKI